MGIYFYRIHEYRDWTCAPATVVEVTLSHSIRRGGSHRIYYTFTIGNERYAGSDVYSGRQTNFEAGDEKEIWYDPKDPNRTSFQKPRPGLDPLGPWIIGIPLAVVSYRYGSDPGRKARKV